MKELSENHTSYVHPTAVVDEGAIVHAGVKIWHFSHVMRGASIGAGSILGQNVFVGVDVVVGNGCKIQNNVSLYTAVELESDVFCGPSCVFTNVEIPRAFIERKQEFKKTVVKKGASIGANATIVCGSTIGAYALIGAGAVVTKDIPAYALVLGVPARVVGFVCECGHRLSELGTCHLGCAACNKQYERDGDGVRPVV